MGEHHTEETLFKVREILMGKVGDLVELSQETAEDLIRRFQNAGILFREFTDEEIPSETTTEVPYDFPQPLSKDEVVRLECLQMATQTIPLNRTGNEGQFIERARYFEQYVRNGAYEEAKNG